MALELFSAKVSNFVCLLFFVVYMINSFCYRTVRNRSHFRYEQKPDPEIATFSAPEVSGKNFEQKLA